MPYVRWQRIPAVQQLLKDAHDKCLNLQDQLELQGELGGDEVKSQVVQHVSDICICLQTAYVKNIEHILRTGDKQHGMPNVVNKTLFEGLYGFIMKMCCGNHATIQLSYLIHSLTKIISLAIDIQNVEVHIPEDIQHDDYLSKDSQCNDGGFKVYEVAIPRTHIAMAVASMFLCVTGNTDVLKFGYDYSEFFQCFEGDNMFTPQAAKLHMILEYFNRLSTDGGPQGHMVFRKIVAENLPDELISWQTCDVRLCKMEVRDSGRLEDEPAKFIQTDFANEYIGGGVLESGRVQEEIRFCTAPELQAAALFISVMKHNEAIQICGFETYSDYSGYADSLEFHHAVRDKTERDDQGVIKSYLTAIDAIPYFGSAGAKQQYRAENLIRDINKALAGFYQPFTYTASHDKPPNENELKSGMPVDPPKVDDEYRHSCQTDDLALVHTYAESVSQRLMLDIWYNLRLIVPDYFGFNVVHYDPLREVSCDDDSMDTAAPNSHNAAGDAESHHASACNDEPYSVECADLQTGAISSVVQYSDYLANKILSQSFSLVTDCNYHQDHELEPEKTPQANNNVSRDEQLSHVDNISTHAMSPIYEDISETSLSTSYEGASYKRRLSDSIKANIHHYSETMADELISAALVEVRERRRLFIENNVTSTQFHAARRMSDEVVGQIFSELQNEADNSISDAEKLRKIPCTSLIEDYANDFVSEVISKATRRCVISPHHRSAGQTPDYPNQTDLSRRKYLGRRSSAPVARKVRQCKEDQARRGSEPAFMFRTRSPHNPYAQTRQSSDVIRLEFDRDSRQANHCSTSSRSLDEHFQMEFSPSFGTQRSNSTSSIQHSPRSTPSIDDSCADVSQISQTGDVNPTSSMSVIREAIQEASDYLISSQHSNIQLSSTHHSSHEQISEQSHDQIVCEQLIKPSELLLATADPSIPITDNADLSDPSVGLADSYIASNAAHEHTACRPSAAHRPPRIHYNDMPYSGYNWQSGAVSPGASLLYINPPPVNTSINSPQSPLQYQYLQLYSEVMAENILHECYGEIREMTQSNEMIDKDQKDTELADKLHTAVLDGCMVKCEPNSPKTMLRPVATGNWGCGVFGGDPEFKSLLQWMAASRANVPKLRYYTFGDTRVSNRKLEKIVDLLEGRTVGYLMDMLVEYGEHQTSTSHTRVSVFDFIKQKLATG